MREVTVLLVDDDDVDVMAVQRAFRKQRIANPLVIARNGLEALELLRGGEGRPKLARPFLILLDLNMPQMNGLEFLAELRKDPDHHRDIVFVLTTSDSDRDKATAYAEHIAGYVVKTRLGDDFMELMRFLTPYWRVVELEER